MQNKLMSMSVLMAAMMGVGLVGCSKPAEKTEQTKTETKAAPAASGDTLRWGFYIHSLARWQFLRPL
jgi:urea transport system substrate-binding protein